MFYVDIQAARYIIDDWFEIDELENYYVALPWRIEFIVVKLCFENIVVNIVKRL